MSEIGDLRIVPYKTGAQNVRYNVEIYRKILWYKKWSVLEG